jgi:hypothetical protein
MGFCKIPISLIKRYASELDYDIKIVASCLETERLNQLEKNGNFGVSCEIIKKNLIKQN